VIEIEIGRGGVTEVEVEVGIGIGIGKGVEAVAVDGSLGGNKRFRLSGFCTIMIHLSSWPRDSFAWAMTVTKIIDDLFQLYMQTLCMQT
jgi:hypothetical protein